MNILFFNRTFSSNTDATGQFLLELCEDLVSYGNHVTVVTSSLSHLDAPLIRFYLKKENYKSIEVIRGYGTKLPKNILLFRLINLATYFILAFLGGLLVKKRPDIIVATTDPPLLGLLGIFFSKLYKAKFVYSCKDIYPEIGIITGKLKDPFLNFLLEKVNLLSFKSANKIVSLGEDMKKILIKKGIDEEKIAVMHDWADTKNLYPVLPENNPFRLKYNLQNFFTVMYSGNIGLTQALEKVIDVAVFLKDKNEIKFIFIGDGVNKASLQRKVSNLKLNNVIFLSYQSGEELKYSLSAPDIHLIPCLKGLTGVIVPSKIYGIISCGKPFIAWVDDESEISKIAKEYNCGIVVPPEDVNAMTCAIEWSQRHKERLCEMGQNGRETAIKYFDRKISTSKFNELLLKLQE
ncbi:MAG: glycosyltransferase family 4 protein [Candidatus Melainabacteria bacterium]|nr:glycosyltransferase family 4 protein [Candidatus Melainabacteria bacterium]